MKDRVKYLDKEFELSIPEEKILTAIDNIAEKMNKDLDGKNPLFVCILNGSFMFASDLLKRIKTPCEISFVKLSSYQGTGSTGKVKQIIGFNENIDGRLQNEQHTLKDDMRTYIKMHYDLKEDMMNYFREWL